MGVAAGGEGWESGAERKKKAGGGGGEGGDGGGGGQGKEEGRRKKEGTRRKEDAFKDEEGGRRVWQKGSKGEERGKGWGGRGNRKNSPYATTFLPCGPYPGSS